MNALAVISARGGSKRLPRKNVLALAGKPLIGWTIESALQAESLARVIVSTDDPEIAEISRQFGAEVPFIRPTELASDTTTSVDVVLHVLDWLMHDQQPFPSLILLLQPTSPLRTPDDINASIRLQKEKKANAIVSVCEDAHPISFLKSIGSTGELLSISVDVRVDPIFRLNGAIYLVSTSVFIKEKTFIPNGCFAYIMPPERSIDIDTAWEFHIADLVLKERHVANLC